MKQVLRHIFERRREYERRPLFDFLRDESRSPRQRLAFAPCMAPLILAFADLNRHVLRDASSTDPDTGIELRYFGDFHLALETGQATNGDHAALAAVELDAPTRGVALAQVDEVFHWFGRWSDELLRFALVAPVAQAH